jgi:hypothetical protein
MLLPLSVGNRVLPRAAVVIEPVSGENLCKTGISADRAGDFRQFRSRDWETGSLETKSMREKPGFPGL